MSVYFGAQDPARPTPSVKKQPGFAKGSGLAQKSVIILFQIMPHLMTLNENEVTKTINERI